MRNFSSAILRVDLARGKRFAMRSLPIYVTAIFATGGTEPVDDPTSPDGGESGVVRPKQAEVRKAA